MNMYADYMKERANLETLEKDFGFAMYRIEGEVLFISEIYVYPEKRKHGLAKVMLRELAVIAKAAGLKSVVGNMWVNAPGVNDSVMFGLSAGAKIIGARDGAVVMELGV